MIRESICAPFLTGEMLVLDNDNIINNMQIHGGDICEIQFNSPHHLAKGGTYTQVMRVIEIKGEQSPENKELRIYTISLIGSEYFTDRGTLTSETTTQGMTGCQLTQKIWREKGFETNLEQPVQDAPLRQGNQPFHVDVVKPLTAIGEIRDAQYYPSYPTGNVLLYRDRYNVVHVPLQHIYERAAGGTEYIQRETWGHLNTHMFGDDKATHDMIEVKEVSRASMLDPKEFQAQSTRSQDPAMGKMSLNNFLGALKGGPNFAQDNFDRVPPAQSYVSFMDKARLYAILLKSFPQYIVKVPMVSGLETMVGLSVFLRFVKSRSVTENASGNYLVTDLVHEIHNDLREVTGTTTLNCLKQGYPTST